MDTEFPAAMRARLARIRTVVVEFDQDHDELVMKATWRVGFTTRDDRKELAWVLGSRFWPAGWSWDLRELKAFAC